jgi:hypothetical protein
MFSRITPQISDAPIRVTQNTFMVGARSLHLLVMRWHTVHKQSPVKEHAANKPTI